MGVTRPHKKKGELQVRPGPNFIADLVQVGPREREPVVSFVQRITGLATARDLWLSTARETGSIDAVCTALGVPRKNLHYYLRRVGLRPLDLEAAASERTKGQVRSSQVGE